MWEFLVSLQSIRIPKNLTESTWGMFAENRIYLYYLLKCSKGPTEQFVRPWWTNTRGRPWWTGFPPCSRAYKMDSGRGI